MIDTMIEHAQLTQDQATFDDAMYALYIRQKLELS